MKKGGQANFKGSARNAQKKRDDVVVKIKPSLVKIGGKQRHAGGYGVPTNALGAQKADKLARHMC